MERDFTGDQKQKVADFIVNSLLYFALAWSFVYKFRAFEIQESKLLWPVFWVTQESVSTVVSLCFWALYTAPILTLFKKTRLLGQVFTFVAALFVISISYSNGKSYHSGLSWIIFMFSYFGVRFFFKPQHAIHFAFFCFSTAYINSGIWKLRSLLNYIWDTGDFSVILYSLQEHISSSAVERVQEPTWLGEVIINNIWISGAFWMTAIAFELSPILIPFYRKHAWIIALGLWGFHLGVLLVLRINFLASMVLLLVLALYFYLVKEKISTSNDF